MAKKKTLPTRKALIAKLDRTFSKYIRLRDTHGGEYFRCISCGKIKTKDKADCGHFFSRRRLSVRWDEKNCHSECAACNRFDSEHLLYYRENLIKKIGQKEFEALEVRANQTSKISDFEIDALNTHYNNLIKILEKTQKSAERQYNRMRKKDNSD